MVDHIRKALSSFEPKLIESNGMPRAAVLIALYDHEAGTPHVLFTVRTELVEHHKGQISFPGGAQDPEDADLASTALRESEEEIGLRREHIELWGQLDDIITISNFVVTPYVGRVTAPAPYAFVPHEMEVAELLAVPLCHLLAPSMPQTTPSSWREHTVPPPSYPYGDHLIWGATARLLQRFLELARE